MDEGTLHIRHSPARERYEAVLETNDGEVVVGYLDYVKEIEQRVLTHTVIHEQYSGRGYAGQLVKAVLDDIRPTGDLVVPVCSYVQTYIQRHPEYADMAVPVRQ